MALKYRKLLFFIGTFWTFHLVVQLFSDHKKSLKTLNWFLIEFRLFLFSDGTIYDLLLRPKSFPLNSTINNLFFHWTQTTWKQAQERKKIFFSPIIFLLLNTFTQYNFKMPTSYFLYSNLEVFSLHFCSVLVKLWRFSFYLYREKM